MTPVGHIAELWRYPVKSMRGEPLTESALDEHGLVGDRRFAFSSTAAPIGMHKVAGRERVALLRYKPFLTPEPTIASPQGEHFPLDSPETIAHLDTAVGNKGSEFRLQSSFKPFTDVRPISLVSTSTLRAISEEFGESLDPQRFRSNIILTLANDDPFAEDAWAGRTLRLGDAAELHILERIPRCSVVGLDPDTSAFRRSLLTLIFNRHGGRLGIYARVQSPHILRVGDPIYLL